MPKPPVTDPAPEEAQANEANEKHANEVGADSVQSQFDDAEKQGFFGVKVDPLPNEAYSLEGGPPTAGNTSAK